MFVASVTPATTPSGGLPWHGSVARREHSCTLGSALLILSGCDRIASQGDSDFARAALERNPDLTIVASDKDANTFTVQVKGSSELRVIRADEVIGTLPSTGVAPARSETAQGCAGD